MNSLSQFSPGDVKIGQINASACLFLSATKTRRLECAQVGSTAGNNPTALGEFETIDKGL